MKVLIVGLGSIGKKHIAALRIIDPGVEIFALRHSANAQQFDNIKNIYRIDHIAVSNFDFAIVANPTAEHKKTINELIRFQMPLFIEKPLHASLDILPLVEMINSLGIITYVACNLRFLDSLKYLKALLGKQDYGQLNEVNVYCGSFLPNWRPETDFRKTYSAIPALGGGVHIDLIHELDYVYWMFGQPVKVRKSFKNSSSLKIDAVDYANYLFEYDHFCVNVVLNYFRKDTKRTFELVFENETLLVDLLKNQIYSNSGTIYSSDKLIADSYLEQMKYFIHCVSNRQTTMNSIGDAYNVLKICLENDIER